MGYEDDLPDDDQEIDDGGIEMVYPSGLVPNAPEWLQPRLDHEALLACVHHFGTGTLSERFPGVADGSRSEGRGFRDAVGIVRVTGTHVFPQWTLPRLDTTEEDAVDSYYEGPIDSMSIAAVAVACEEAVGV